MSVSTVSTEQPLSWLAQGGPVNMIVGGESREAADGRWIVVENPAKRGSRIAEVPRANEQDVDSAVRIAHEAFLTWRKVAPRERGRLISRIADAMEEESEVIAQTIALETGNALRPQSRPETKTTVDIFRYFGGVASELKGEVVPFGEDLLVYNRREPLGVVGGIVPWNAPVLLASLKIAMSLVAGNTLVLKAAEDAPLAVLYMSRICNRFLPPGVLNVLTGYGEEAGAALAKHPLVRKLSFTGSTEVGRLIMHAAADRIVPVSLELGGKSPAIVFPDSNTEETVTGVINGMRFTRQAQSCTAGSRLFLHKDIYDSFLQKLAAALVPMKIGNPLDESTDIGTLINRKQYDRVCGYIRDAQNQKGSEILLGRLPTGEGLLSEGYYVEPMIVARGSNEWRIAREEIFGPVVVAIPWSDESEVLQMANDSHYGLAAYVWCRDIKKALKMAHSIDSGWVQVNRGLGQLPGHSYGGYKMSGIGREFSLEGMLESFTQRKSVTVNLA